MFSRIEYKDCGGGGSLGYTSEEKRYLCIYVDQKDTHKHAKNTQVLDPSNTKSDYEATTYGEFSMSSSSKHETPALQDGEEATIGEEAKPITIKKWVKDNADTVPSPQRIVHDVKIEGNTTILNYPGTGKVSLCAGTTVIDVKSRQVILPDRTSYTMYGHGHIESALCILLFIDTTSNLKLFLKGTPVFVSSIFPEWFPLSGIEFDLIEITTSKETLFYVVLSNNADAISLVSPAGYTEGNPYVNTTTVAIAGTPNTEEIYAALERNGRNGTLTHNGLVGYLYVEVSHNGVDFTDPIPVEAGGKIVFDGDDIHTVYIDASIDGIEYTLTLS